MLEEERDCFGILGKVFPVRGNGLREVPPECRSCPERTQCLKTALSTREGLLLRDELIDRAAARGMIGRLQRWSRKKALDRLMKQVVKQEE